MSVDDGGDEYVTEELRSLFLFESLTDDQLDALCRDGHMATFEPGLLFTEGTPATCLYVLIDGEVALCKRSGGIDIETIRTSQRGAYFGAWSAFLDDEQTYETSASATEPSRMFVIEAASLGAFLRAEFPMACHFLVGQSLGRFHEHRIVGPHDRLVQLVQLTAGLTHELNNPAAAALRATSELRTRVAGMRHKLSLLADGAMSAAAMHALVDIGDRAAEVVAKAGDLTPLEKSDREGAIGDWLDDRGVSGAWDLAPTFAEAGLHIDWLERVAATIADEGGQGQSGSLDVAVRWLTSTIESELLMNEITESTKRVATLVGQAKQYSQLDRAPFDMADLHVLLSNTLAMLSHRFRPDITVVEDFDESLEPMQCFPAEFNQVWTNLIDNAVTAMRSVESSDRTLTIRTRRQGDIARVEVCDTGPGVPEELRERIFDPFFTTKPVGEGSGLGLDFAARIVDKHRGSLWVESKPGDTRFIAVLPLTTADVLPKGSQG